MKAEQQTQTLGKLADGIYKSHGREGGSVLVLALRKRSKEVFVWAAEVLLGDSLRRDRKRINDVVHNTKSGGPPTEEDIDLITGSAAGDWPLWNGVQLRDATYEQIGEQIAFLEAHAKGTLRSLRFLRCVYAKLEPGDIAGEKLAESAFVAAKQETEQETEPEPTHA